jgi:hypothetical protein
MRVLSYLALSFASLAAEPSMQTRVFQLPVELIGGDTFKRLNELPAADPIGFHKPPPAFQPTNPEELAGPAALRQSAKAVLLNEGIPFPSGARAEFNPQTGMLVVHNTPANLEHVRLFLKAFEKEAPVNHSFLVTVVEAPGAMIRLINTAAGSTPDCQQPLSALLSAASRRDSGVSIIGDGFLECRSGQSFRLSSVREHLHPGRISSKADRSIATMLEQIGVGFQFEGSNLIGGDEGNLVAEVSLKVSTLPPTQRLVAVSDPETLKQALLPMVDHWKASFQCSISIQPGQTRLIGITKPPGAKDSDVLWAAFLQVGSHPIPSTATYAISMEEADKQSKLKKAVFEVPPGLLEHHVQVEPAETLQRWLDANGLEPNKKASADYKEGRLSVTNTQENIERVHGLLRDMSHAHVATAGITFRTIAAPAGRLRDLVRQHVVRGDHAAAWRMLEDNLASGEASLVDLVRLVADANSHARHESGNEYSFIDEFAANASGQLEVSFDQRIAGTIIQIDLYRPPGEDLLGLSLNHENHTRSPEPTKLSIKPAASEQPISFPLLDFFPAKSEHTITITPGRPRMISLHRPHDPQGQDMLWATFVTCELHPIIAPRAPETRSESSTTKVQRDETRALQFPQAFIASMNSGWGQATGDDARRALIQAGIRLPESARIQTSGSSGIFRVTASAEFLDQIEAVLKKSQERLEKAVAVTAHLIEAPAAVITHEETQILSKTDHTDLWQELQNHAKIGRAKHLTTLRLTARSEARSEAAQTNDSPCLVAIQPNEKGENELLMEPQPLGHRLELTPRFGSSGAVIALDWALLSRRMPDPPPANEAIDGNGTNFQFPAQETLLTRIQSNLTLAPEAPRLVWIYRPPGGAKEVVHLLFLQTTEEP